MTQRPKGSEAKGQPEDKRPDINLAETVGNINARIQELRLLLSQGWILKPVLNPDNEVKILAYNGLIEKHCVADVLEFLTSNTGILREIWGKATEGKGNLKVATLFTLIVDNAPKAIDLLQQLTTHFVDKDLEWVETNLLLEDLLEVTTPFFGVEARLLKKLLAGWVSKLQPASLSRSADSKSSTS